MTNKRPYKRKKFLINKQFQFDFAIRFLVLIVVAAVAALAIFLYHSRGTLTTSYSGSELTILRTSDFFLPVLLMTTIGVIIVTSIIGIIVLVYLSHRIAGPIFRFQAVLDAIDKGDLTHRFKLRDADQFTELADRINDLAKTMDAKIGSIKATAADLTRLVHLLRTLSASHPALQKEFERPLHEIVAKLSELQDVANHFKTSHTR